MSAPRIRNSERNGRPQPESLPTGASAFAGGTSLSGADAADFLFGLFCIIKAPSWHGEQNNVWEHPWQPKTM